MGAESLHHGLLGFTCPMGQKLPFNPCWTDIIKRVIKDQNKECSSDVKYFRSALCISFLFLSSVFGFQKLGRLESVVLPYPLTFSSHLYDLWRCVLFFPKLGLEVPALLPASRFVYCCYKVNLTQIHQLF